MALEGLTLVLGRSEFSRFEAERSAVVVRVVSAGNVSEPLTFAYRLIRKQATEVEVFSGEGTIPVGNPPVMVLFSIDLKTAKDADGIPAATSGTYAVEVMAGSITERTPDFVVSLVTADQMRALYCRGATLYSNDVLKPVKQPSRVTGVTIAATEAVRARAVKNLTYTVTEGVRTLQWGTGPAVTLTEGLTQEILLDTDRSYVEVTVDWYALPSESAAEAILIDKERMDDTALRGHIRQAVSEVEGFLKCFVEPMRCATQPYFAAPEDGEYFDREVEPVAYYKSDFNALGIVWHMQLGQPNLLKVDTMEGWLGDTKVLSVESGSYQVNRKAGTVDILPHHSQYSYLWHFFNQRYYWGIRDYVANFWRWKGKAGIPIADDDVLKMVGFTAAITIMTVAGQAYKGGYSSESISKDGVTQSRSYTASAVYGIYSATIDQYEKWLKDNKDRIVQRIGGIRMVTL